MSAATPVRIAGQTAGRVASNAGITPTSTVVTAATASVYASIRVFRKVVTSSRRLATSPISPTSARVVTPATTRAARAPTPTINALSVSSCSTTRRRDAPIASRMAISFIRADARAICRLAMFAQVITSRRTVIAITAVRGVSRSRRSADVPRWPSSSRTRPCWPRSRDGG
jgi:hypothetical protein